MKKYDLAVIGAGSAGLVAATTANRKGLKTIMIEKNKIGGECTHSGCVPSKAFLNAAKAWSAIHHTKKLGLPKVKAGKLNFAKVMEKVNEIVDGIYEHEKPAVFEKQGIDVRVHKKGAVFLDAETLKIGRETIQAKHSIICTGSSPRLLSFEGDEGLSYLHNENFWALRKQPKRIVFIGGGVISVELGSALARLGTQVFILDHGPRILKVADSEVVEVLTKQLSAEGVKLLPNSSIVQFKQTKEGYVAQIDYNGKKRTIKADAWFQAVGRVPNIHGMQLEKAGVEYTERGIRTNAYLRSTAKNIYACGDVTTPYKFTHTASHQANICVDNILQGNRKRNDLNILPWAIFTEPEIGHVGLSEKQACEKYGDDIQVFKVDASIDRFITDQKTGGFLKVIFDKKNQVIGADAIGHHAGEWIQLLTLVMKNKIPASKMADTIFAYPTYSEIVKKAFTRFLRTKA